MSAPSERAVLGAMGLKGLEQGCEAVAELLVTLGYPDVAKELRLRVDDWNELWSEQH